MSPSKGKKGVSLGGVSETVLFSEQQVDGRAIDPSQRNYRVPGDVPGGSVRLPTAPIQQWSAPEPTHGSSAA